MGKHNKKKWSEYYSVQPRHDLIDPLLKKGLNALSKTKISRTQHAIDLGCGRGHDSVGLLESGFFVTAIDSQSQAIKLLEEIIPKKFKKKILTKVSRFENLTMADFESVDIINAIYSLFFCRPSSFDRFWYFIQESIVHGGIFCGNFIGKKDSWAKKRGITSVSKVKLKKMFKNFEIISLIEKENNKGTLTGKAKHWHVFSVVARKKEV